MDLREELFAIWQADMEIQNGGIAQFLLNSSGDLAEEAVSGLRRFGLPQLGDVLEDAFKSLAAGQVPQTAEERRRWIEAAVGEAANHVALMRKLADRMRPFDRSYYDIKQAIDGKLGGQGVLWQVCAFVESHRDIFFPAH